MLSPDGDALMGGASPNVRAPIPQMRDQLISHDPAQRGPRGPPPPTAAEGHALEAFRDFRRESGGAGGSGAGAAAGAAGGSSSPDEVFGLAKKPKNLAEIYKAPTDLCFQGTFEELRDAGRAQGRWLLVNIQSPTEFASQQLNADTWTDETLRTVINARRARIHARTHAARLRSTPSRPLRSYLFWRRYHDSAEGKKFCTYYRTAALPHIAIIDPVTGASVKQWSGFKDAERLMDKLTELADSPPADVVPMDDYGGAAAAAAPRSSGAAEEDAALQAALAASLGGAAGGDATASAMGVPPPCRCPRRRPRRRRRPSRPTSRRRRRRPPTARRCACSFRQPGSSTASSRRRRRSTRALRDPPRERRKLLAAKKYHFIEPGPPMMARCKADTPLTATFASSASPDASRSTSARARRESE